MSSVNMVLPPPNDNIGEALAAVPIFVDLPGAVLNAVEKISEWRRYASGQSVLTAGQYAGEEFYVVVSGRMRISYINLESGSIYIEEFGAGSVFALEFAFGSSPDIDLSNLNIDAEDDLSVIMIESEAFHDLTGNRPSLMRNVAKHFAKSICTNRFNTVAVEAAPERRVFSALLNFVERNELNGQWHIPQMPKHRELAEKAGVEEALSAEAVASLIQEGVARREYPGLIITDISRLNRLAG